MKLASLSSRVDAVIGVSITPGAMAFTRMPSAARSRASDCVSIFTPPLDGEPNAAPTPANEAIEPTLMITPRVRAARPGRHGSC